jgi:hypothetical protein
MRFFTAEVDAYNPGAITVLTVAQGFATRPRGTLAALPDAAPVASTLYASDLGYRTAPADAGGPAPYPPLLTEAFQISAALNLDPATSAAAAAWGELTMSNTLGQLNAVAGTWNSDARPVRVAYGDKPWDAARGYFTDPAYSTLTPVFNGMATPWFLSDTNLHIPLRDATYWLDRPLQSNLYGGTGAYDGTAAMAGMPKPKTRGGTTGAPVRNVTPALVDPANRIYQYNDGPGTVAALYEGAALTITVSADTTNLYAGSTPAGQYRTDNSRGLFQLGSAPAHAITANVTGQFPVAGIVTNAASIARYILSEDMALPAANLNIASFTTAAAAYPFTAGLYFPATAGVSGVAAVAVALAGWGAKLVPYRDGTLRVLVLTSVPPGTTPVASFDPSNIVGCVPTPLPATLDPPPYRMRAGYNHNYTVQTSDLNTATATAAQLAFVATSDTFAANYNAALQLAYRRPNDLTPLAGSLLVAADALTVVNNQTALWGVRRRVYSISVPVGIALPRDIGDVVKLTYPLDSLTSGQLGLIIGYTFKSTDSTVVLQVLV